MDAPPRSRGLDRPLRAKARFAVRVQKQFDLHPLAIEDAEHAHQHPTAEEYGNTMFVVTQTAQLVDARIALGAVREVVEIEVGDVVSG